MTLLELARKLRTYIEKAAISLSDEDALEAVDLFPNWSPDNTITYHVGDRVKYQEVLYKCLIEHTPQEAWTPVAAPSLWVKVLIPSPDVIPEWEQPSAGNAYMKGDKVMFEGKAYESLIDNNVWSPAAYPAGWKEI